MAEPSKAELGSQAEERRCGSRFARLPDDDFAAVWIGSEEPQLAEVHDESLHGISLIIDDDSGIGVGCEVHIVYAGACHLARAMRVRPHGSGKLLIGFACEQLPELSSEHIRESSAKV
mgnify:CR=1 FL=1